MNYLGRAGLLFLLVLFVSSIAFAQTPEQRAEIARQYDQARLAELQSQFQEIQLAQKNEVIRLARQNGWPTQYTFAEGFGQAEIAKVGPNGKPIYYQTHNVDAAASTRTDHLNTGGSLGLNLDGQNMTAYVWDGGAARATHQEFDGAGGNNRVSQGDGATGLSAHATHVMGTMVASGFVAAAKGMSWQAQGRAFDWNSDISEMTSQASGGMLVSNHSYGYGWRNQQGQVQLPAYYGGAYINESRNVDQVLYNAPYYMMFVSAGNDGTDDTANSNPLDGNSSYDKLNAFKCAKNNVVVAAANDANVNANGTLNSYSIASFSSEGPTDDYRIKPDITGNGVGVYSPLSGSDSQYGNYNGTSMASPNVSGSALLLQQHYNDVNGSFMRGATLKGLMLHTADDGGPTGPDAVYGWGLMNAKAAAEAISNDGNSSLIQELSLSQGQSYQISVSAAGGPLYASICWTDPAGTANTGTVNLSTPVLVNDLDIRVTQGGTTYNPWALTGVTTNAKQDNLVDPYERVDIDNASGSYTITVTHKGSLTSGSQAYTLIVTGLTPCTLPAPGNLTSSNITNSSFDLSWNAVSGANGYTVTINGSQTTVSGTSYSATGLIAGTPYNCAVSANCAGGGSGTPATTLVTTTGTRPLSCNGTVSSFPYAEGFESGAGWTQEGGDDGDWVRYSGSTPSSSTGPTSASEGSFYLYLEASTNGTPGQIGNNGTAILGSPCFDLSGASAADFSFQYHMYGINMGSLAVEATSDDLTWTNLWSRSGDQGNQWSTANINLDSYAGASVKLRIVGTTGPGWQSDLAIDDLSLTATGGPDTQAPTVPTGLASSNVTHNSFDVSWTASSDNVGVAGYNVYLDGTLDGTTAGTSYSFTGLNASTSYTVTVSAYDAAGNTSAQSAGLPVTTSAAPDTQAPSVPNGLASSNVTSNSFDVSWTASSDNVGVTGYNVYLDGAFDGTTAGTSYSFTGLNASTSYTVTVSAYDAAGNTSAQSAGLPVTTSAAPDTQAPSVPNGLASSNVTSNSFDVSWTASSDNVGVTGYNVYLDGAFDGTTAGTSYSFTGLNASTSYTVTVSAYDAAGNTSAQSAGLPVTTSAAPDTQAPSVPNGLASSNVTTSSFDVSWTASSDNVGVTGYNVYLDGAFDGTTTGTSYSFTGLNASTSYTVTVSAYDAAGNTSAQSAGLPVSTSAAPDTQAPSVPNGLASSNVTSSSFDVNWAASSDNVGVTGYNVYLNSGFQGTTTGTSYSFSGLSASTSYTVTVSAYDAASNTSAQSSGLPVTTSAASGPVAISGSYFETGWDDWNDGGADNNRASNAKHAWEGTRTNRIRNGTSSSFTTSDPFNLSGFSSVEIDFHYKSVGMENGDYFELQYNDGSGFVTVTTWTRGGGGFSNNVFYNEIVTLNSSNYNLSSNATFRFRNFGNAKNDRIFLDAIIITGTPTGGNAAPAITGETFEDNEETSEVADVIMPALQVYPNPVQDILHFESSFEAQDVYVVNMKGQIVMRDADATGQLNVSNLPKGVYILSARTENGKIVSKKFMKQ